MLRSILDWLNEPVSCDKAVAHSLVAVVVTINLTIFAGIIAGLLR